MNDFPEKIRSNSTTSSLSTLAAIVVYLVFLLLSGVAPTSIHVETGGFVVFCLVTAVIEECIFCGIMLPLIARSYGNAAIYICALLFGIAHLNVWGKDNLTLVILLTVLKMGQAFAFMCVMEWLYLKVSLSLKPKTLLQSVRVRKASRSISQAISRLLPLLAPVVCHFAFDVTYFALPFAETGTLPPYQMQIAPDANLIVLLATTIVFAVAAFIMYKFGFNSHNVFKSLNVLYGLKDIHGFNNQGDFEKNKSKEEPRESREEK